LEEISAPRREKQNPRNLHPKYLKIVYGTIDGLNAPTRVAYEERCGVRWSMAIPAPTLDFHGRFRA